MTTVIHCPKHPKEKLRRLLYHQKMEVGAKMSKNIYPDLWYCAKCERVFSFKFQLSEVPTGGGDQI